MGFACLGIGNTVAKFCEYSGKGNSGLILVKFSLSVTLFSQKLLWIFGPTDFGGWSYRLALVRASVRLFRVFLKNRSWNFNETWHDVEEQQWAQTDEAKFLIKKYGG